MNKTSKSKENNQKEPMFNYSFDKTVKILVIGDSAVGKTSIISRYVDRSCPSNYIATIGIDFKEKT